jgi:hypothetical protein
MRALGLSPSKEEARRMSALYDQVTLPLTLTLTLTPLPNPKPTTPTLYP